MSSPKAATHGVCGFINKSSDQSNRPGESLLGNNNSDAQASEQIDAAVNKHIAVGVPPSGRGKQFLVMKQADQFFARQKTGIGKREIRSCGTESPDKVHRHQNGWGEGRCNQQLLFGMPLHRCIEEKRGPEKNSRTPVYTVRPEISCSLQLRAVHHGLQPLTCRHSRRRLPYPSARS